MGFDTIFVSDFSLHFDHNRSINALLGSIKCAPKRYRGQFPKEKVLLLSIQCAVDDMNPFSAGLTHRKKRKIKHWFCSQDVKMAFTW